MYAIRSYYDFVKQWDRFEGYPGGVLAHSTHVKGAGDYDAAVPDRHRAVLHDARIVHRGAGRWAVRRAAPGPSEGHDLRAIA